MLRIKIKQEQIASHQSDLPRYSIATLVTMISRSVICRNISSSIGGAAVQSLEKSFSGISGTAVVCPQKVTASKGIVLLFGWASSTVKSVMRYGKVYSEMGVPSVCAATPFSDMWFKPRGDMKAKQVLDTLSDSIDDKCPLILHFFSGAVFTYLPPLVELLSAQKYSKFQLSGIVLDSAPVSYRCRTGVASAKLLKQQGVYDRLSYYSFAAVNVSFAVLTGQRRRKNMRSALDHPIVKVPQLYLYSNADTVALKEDVEGEMERQACRGVDVSSHRWSDSAHVRHLANDPHQYASQVQNFLNKLSFM